jgi:hypothetical protein
MRERERFDGRKGTILLVEQMEIFIVESEMTLLKVKKGDW